MSAGGFSASQASDSYGLNGGGGGGGVADPAVNTVSAGSDCWRAAASAWWVPCAGECVRMTVTERLAYVSDC